MNFFPLSYQQFSSRFGLYSFFFVFWLFLYQPPQSGVMPCNANFSVSSVNCNVVSFTPADNTQGLTYLWDFGDGTTSTESSPDHVFATAIGNGKQSFNVTLTVNGPNCDGATSAPMTVEVDQVPDINLEDADTDLFGNSLNFVHCADGTLRIRDNSTTKATNRSYEIDWGDGSAPFTGNNIPNNTSHTYNLPGQYDITVTVTGDNNCTNSKVIPFFFGSNPSVGF
ncbi:MAG TPA: PKD domain-containing protein, partial [Saprospiraceae bacterium]|nr:PKD domain-containing protein [Saprospiraceae bacterium]